LVWNGFVSGQGAAVDVGFEIHVTWAWGSG
jgi:hypothetical protein